MDVDSLAGRKELEGKNWELQWSHVLMDVDRIIEPDNFGLTESGFNGATS